MKKKRDLPVGQKIKGYGLLNEYGEFDFIPEQTGSRQGQVKVVKETANYSISYSKNRVNVNIHMKRQNGLELMKSYMKIVNEVLFELRSYEF